MAGFLIALSVLSWLALLAVDVVLIVAAWRTTPMLGILTLLLPFYAVSTGNWRLKTERRGLIARAWWACFALFVVTLGIPK
jgi:hypothetical protein